MKHSENTQEKPNNIKKKLMSALAMLLIATILMTTTSYAWFIMAIAPEVTGITTSVGANGSLEIALLDKDTWADPSTVKTSFRGSLQNGTASANYTWGNLVDLSYDAFGLSNITLMPSRLNVSGNAQDGYSVTGGILSVPTYGYDGRIIELHKNTLSAIYGSGAFSYISGTQDYGVRAIGTNSSLSAQAAALAAAKTNILSHKNTASSTASATLNKNGEALFDILFNHVQDANTTYGNDDRDTIVAMVTDLGTSLEAIDLALRQGLIAYAASETADESTFNLLVDEINAAEKLSVFIAEMEAENVTFPDEFKSWVTDLENMQNDLNAASNACNALTSGTYTWTELSGALKYLIDSESSNVFINEYKLSELDRNTAMGLLGTDVSLTLGPDSGIFANIADFTDDYTASIIYMGMDIETTTRTLQNPVYLDTLYAGVSQLEAADNTTTGRTLDLTNTYGYALDLAFRCNAAMSDLLLQTTPEQRIYTDSTATGTMGGGSYMEFSADDENLTLRQITMLMDGIRVGFVDSMGNLLGIAKLNTSNRVVDGELVKAPLYLYDYTVSTDPENAGAVIMGERQKTDNVITSLEQSTAKAITVIVWLDGDEVDNSMVSAEESSSISGKLNLQFASSANLVPMEDSNLMSIAADRSGLEQYIAAAKTVYDNGQNGQMNGTQPLPPVTTPTWNKFVTKYNRANAVLANPEATNSQIYFAATELYETVNGLEFADANTLAAKVAELRATMGQTSEVARILLQDEDGVYTSLDTYTQAQAAAKAGSIYHVDYTKNLHDEGNDVYTPVYTDASWNHLASALYDAETVLMNAQNGNATDAEIDEALTDLEAAGKALQRAVFYVPYEYRGTIYYSAICEAENADTYAKWYYSDFTRVVSDKVILDLDADAEPAEIAEIEQSEWVAMDKDASTQITPYVNILSSIYPELSGEEILAAHWELSSLFTKLMSPYQKAYIQQMVDSGKVEAGSAAMTAATNLLNSTDPVSHADASSVIVELENAIANNEESTPADTNLPIYLPTSSETYEFVYAAEGEYVAAISAGKTGTGTLNAVVLTENGVLMTLDKSVTVYEKATGIELEADSASVEAGSTGSISVSLTYDAAPTVGEDIASCTWASKDTDIATVTGDTNGCTVTGVAEGTVTITVSVETVQGNTYTGEIEVTVSAAAAETP